MLLAAGLLDPVEEWDGHPVVRHPSSVTSRPGIWLVSTAIAAYNLIQACLTRHFSCIHSPRFVTWIPGTLDGDDDILGEDLGCCFE